MMLSVNELQSTLLKAGRGAGLPLGLAEDLAWAAPEIAAGPTNPIIAQILASLSAPMSPASVETSSQGGRMALGNPLFVVPSALDLVSGNDSPILIDCAAPDLANALIASRERLRGHPLWFDWINPSRVLLHGWRSAPFSPTPAPERVQVDDPLWSELLELAAKTYVPESDASRIAGAGAGLTDND